jgi:hypothetical protein
VAKVLKGFVRLVDACVLEGKAQKHTLFGRADRPLALIDLQLEVLLEKPSQAGFHAFAGPLAVLNERERIRLSGKQ